MTVEHKTEVYFVLRGVDLRDDAQVLRWRLQGLPILDRWIKDDFTLIYLQGPEEGWFVDDHEDDYDPIYKWRPAIMEMVGIEPNDRTEWYMSHDHAYVAVNQSRFKQVWGGHTSLFARFNLEVEVKVTFDR